MNSNIFFLCLLLSIRDSSGVSSQYFLICFEMLSCVSKTNGCQDCYLWLARGLYLQFCVIIVGFYYSLERGYLQKIKMQLLNDEEH